MKEIAQQFTGVGYIDTTFPCSGMEFCGHSRLHIVGTVESRYKMSNFAENRKNPVPASCKRRQDSVEYPCVSAVSAVASVSWSINSCFSVFGNRVKKQEGDSLFFFALLPPVV